MSTLYPTRQPVTKANLEAALAGAPRSSRPIARLKALTPQGEAALIEQMAETMRHYGEGMTRADLRLAGYSDAEIDLCAEKANARALHLSRN